MTRSTTRILDANFNRAREALRVMEDYARFVLDDATLSADLKALRHDLRQAIESLPLGLLEAARDTPGDVGTTITAESETVRTGTAAVVIAAGKRLSEAMRSLEEYGKTIDSPFAATCETLRYRGYDLEKRLVERLPTGRPAQWKVCVLLTESLCKRPWLEVLEAVLDAGADAVQLREKGLEDGKLLGRANVVARKCREAGAVSIINDRPDIALLAEADGVHLGQQDLPVSFVRRLAGRRLLIGVSTSNLIHAQAAVRSGADYCGVGPMFPTMTKEKPILAGPEYLREYTTTIDRPHLAIGGIKTDNMAELLAAGVRGIAVSSTVCGADDPAAAVQALREMIPDAPGD